ncbi:MAG: SDR family oxidoreductase [Rhodospirillales bacterium]
MESVPRPMRVLLLGATGLIGSTVRDRLLAEGHGVTAICRQLPAGTRPPGLQWDALDLGTLRCADAWRSRLAGIDAVVNAAGLLQDGLGDDVLAVQETAMIALFDACKLAGTRWIVQISAVGATADAPTNFMRTKASADAHLAGLDLDWIIFRPGLVLAPQAYGGSALLRALAAMPLFMPVPPGAGALQTIHVDEVAEAVTRALAGLVPARRSYDLVEPEVHSAGEVVRALRDWLGYRPAPVREVPGAIIAATARIADTLGLLGWRSPFRSTAVAQLRAGVVGDPATWSAVSGRMPSSLAVSLARIPSTVQERWFARMFLVKPAAIFTLALFWGVSGVIAVADPAAAASVLVARGWEEPVALAAVLSGACLDIALGLAVLVKRWLVPAALAMIGLAITYLLLGTVVAPDLWLDPLGAFIKVLPALVLALAVLATAADR